MDLRKALTGLALASSLGLGGAYSLIDKYEPARGDMTKVYLDPLGIPTVCRGHTGPLTRSKGITQAQCDEATVDDLKAAAAVVRSCVTVPLTQGEYNAWTSFAYNVGRGKKGVKDGMCVLKSGAVPSHVRKLQNGQHAAACAMLMQWTMPGTNVHRGLYARRVDEVAMCLHDLKEGSP
jgi:lysozyme